MDCPRSQNLARALALSMCALLIQTLHATASDLANAQSAQPSAGSTTTQPFESASPALAITRAMRNDAALSDLCFINVQQGWAVGDRGVIWHTADGGATWHEQPSNTTVNLSAVTFIDAQHGWAVGGASRPLQNDSRCAMDSLWPEVKQPRA